MLRIISQDPGALDSSAVSTESRYNEDLRDSRVSGDVSGETPANDLLGHLGYDPQLKRNRSTSHVAFMAFVLAAKPYGIATTLNYPLIRGGPVNVIWGWLLVTLIVICVAASLGEITSELREVRASTFMFLMVFATSTGSFKYLTQHVGVY
ncbi:amino acid permease [Colletotrichum asianum]